MKITHIKNEDKHRIWLSVVLLIVTALGTYFLLNNSAFTELAARSLASNTFYIPKKENVTFNGRAMLREACFGGEYYDVEEKTIILNNNTSTPQISNENIKGIPEAELDSESPSADANMLPIIECDLSAKDILILNNTTGKRPDTQQLLYSDYDFGYNKNSNEPLVLVIHTHATECYSREYSTYYDTSSSTRSTDENINMISVGKVLSDTLNTNGVNTLHCTTEHDESSYRDSYTLAAGSIKEYLDKYPSIRYVFDIHRDAVMYESGAKARAITEINGEKAAQIMLLAGTDAGGASFPDWEKNLAFALKLAYKMDEDFPGLMRPVALRGASYNEQYTTGSLLIEIGTDGNTLSQAKYSAELLGKALAELIKK